MDHNSFFFFHSVLGASSFYQGPLCGLEFRWWDFQKKIHAVGLFLGHFMGALEGNKPPLFWRIILRFASLKEKIKFSVALGLQSSQIEWSHFKYNYDWLVSSCCLILGSLLWRGCHLCLGVFKEKFSISLFSFCCLLLFFVSYCMGVWCGLSV